MKKKKKKENIIFSKFTLNKKFCHLEKQTQVFVFFFGFAFVRVKKKMRTNAKPKKSMKKNFKKLEICSCLHVLKEESFFFTFLNLFSKSQIQRKRANKRNKERVLPNASIQK
jgi:hypothetical protein